MTGGRPRNPAVDDRVRAAAVQLLAEHGMPQFTADELARVAGVGKASIYRRWRSTHDLLVDVVAGLSPREVSYPTGDLREDVVALLTAFCTGEQAAALAAVLPLVGRHADLRDAYERGPAARLWAACSAPNGWPLPFGPLQAAVALLHVQTMVNGSTPSPYQVGAAVDRVVLPALAGTEPAR